ncbi:MAG: hypothetical protein GJU72_03640 [Acidithiobacillus ferriphilus]|jgi:hypothetical protein|uniref:hypothetical protein n=1 Tax=Acidithiobacillus ferriphilus TaxID=1689834 RepID=UPI00242B36B1|nr:hypothetical protein [Acidithiobacillus ferriphilus]MBW9248181.1 hypothetical protein [Acidithiobacillus ferriphilus]MBW9254281.1 hypothetical protein [Acidithiobacillus ferriphilus]
MRPVTMHIPGDFWDSQIYAGDMILFGSDGSLTKIDWESMIDDLASNNKSIQTAIRIAFLDSDILYNSKVRGIIKDNKILSIILQQIKEVTKIEIEANDELRTKHSRTFDSSFDFLTTDTDIYYNRILAAGNDGLFSVLRSFAGTREMKKNTTKQHDGIILQVKSSNRNTAIAAASGKDGLIEIPLYVNSEKFFGDPKIICGTPCSGCEWSFGSILAWENNNAFVANFKEIKEKNKKKKTRIFRKIIKKDEILKSSQESKMWGSHEKIFFSSDKMIEVFNYQITDENNDDEFTGVGSKTTEFKTEEIISTGTAPFGTIIELKDKLIVLRSDGKETTFNGEVVHWRIFPRSEKYNNQLHIIYDDHIVIVSFLHDYFVDQENKIVGFSYGKIKNIAAEGLNNTIIL